MLCPICAAGPLGRPLQLSFTCFAPSALLGHRFIQAEDRRFRRQRAERGLRFLRNHSYVKAWNSWCVRRCLQDARACVRVSVYARGVAGACVNQRLQDVYVCACVCTCSARVIAVVGP